MKLYFIFSAVLLSLALYAASCRDKHPPEPEKQYSTWIVNGTDTFRTNDVDKEIHCNPDYSYCVAAIGSNDLANRFDVAFALDYLPDSGCFEIRSNNNTAGVILGTVTFYYDNLFYYHTHSKLDTVFASSVNNKVRYTMPACWFVSYDNPTGDSILIEGVFNEP